MSLRAVSEKLGQQTDLMIEIGTDIYGYLDTVIARSELTSTRLDNLNSTNLQILQTIESAQQPTGDELEARRDQQTFNNQMLGVMRQIAANTGGGSGGGGNAPKQGVFQQSLAGGLGIAAKGIGAGVGLGALGLGIGAFFAGLSAGDAAGSYLNADMSTIKKQMITLGEAFSETPTDGLVKMGALLAAGGAFGALFGPSKAAKGAVGMGAIGLGIGAFFAGLAASDGLITMMGTDGSMLKSQMVNLAEGLNAFSGSSMAALGALLGAGALFGQAPAIAGKAAVGMTLIGAGIGGFLTAFAGIGKVAELIGADGSAMRNIMVNLAEGLNPLSQLDASNLTELGGAMALMAPGLAALLTLDGISNIADTIGTFFGMGDDSESVFEKIYNGLQPLSTLNADNLQGLVAISGVIGGLAGSLERLSDVDYGDVKGSVKDLGKILAFTIPMLDAASKGTTIGEGYFDGYPELNFAPGLEGIPQSTFDKINSVVSVNSASQQSAPTSSNNMSTLIRENNETKNNAPVVIMDNSQNSTVSGGGGGTSIVTGNISPFDTYDPYLVTRK